MDNKKRNIFWIVMLVIFCPFWMIILPIWLLRRLHADPERFGKNSTDVTVYGWVLIAVAAIYLVAGITGSLEAESTSDVIFGVILVLVLFGGCGWLLVRHGRKYCELGKLREMHLPVIAHSPDGNMDKMGISIGLPYDTVKQQLQQLIRCKALPDSYIDEARHCLVSPLVGTCAPRVERRAVQCPHCGGTSQIIAGGKNLCEYCDSEL